MAPAAPRRDDRRAVHGARRSSSGCTAACTGSLPAGADRHRCSAVAAFRGLIDVVVRRLLPWPSMYGADDELAEEDVVARRRVWFWRKFFKRLVVLVVDPARGAHRRSTSCCASSARSCRCSARSIASARSSPRTARSSRRSLLQLPFFLLINFLILFGPLMFVGISRSSGYEPGDADWGVKLDDVRGQAEAKEEITRVVSLWQSGEEFEKARRQARARRALPRRARHRQDDALQGHRDVVQLPVRDDPGLGLRADVHRHGRGDRALPGPQGQEAGQQVGRPVHRLHRRDRRRRHAPPVARLGLPRRFEDTAPRCHDPLLLRPDGRADTPTATSCSRPRRGASGCSRCAPKPEPTLDSAGASSAAPIQAR